MISAKHTPALCLAVALALVPTLLHSYVGVRVSDGRATAAIPSALAGFTSTPTNRNPAWGGRKFESDDWIERRYTSRDDEVVLTVVRSYDLKSLYHHPELEVADGPSFGRPERMLYRGDRQRPFHVLRASGDSGALGIYVLHYDNTLVADPLLFQLRTAAELLFSGRKPMTLVFAHDVQAPKGAAVESLPATSLLFAAVDAFASGPNAQASSN
jgi:hypothetical protein